MRLKAKGLKKEGIGAVENHNNWRKEVVNNDKELVANSKFIGYLKAAWKCQRALLEWLLTLPNAKSHDALPDKNGSDLHYFVGIPLYCRLFSP